jgi:hypothetical protein
MLHSEKATYLLVLERQPIPICLECALCAIRILDEPILDAEIPVLC